MEERTHWRRTDGGHEQTCEIWTEVDSCWDYYGRETAEDRAREALTTRTGKPSAGPVSQVTANT